MSKNSGISHAGIVESKTEEFVEVSLLPGISCSGCQAARSCNISADEKKMITVRGRYNVRRGDKVKVSMKGSQGYSALMLGYVLPLILILFTLIVMSVFSISELLTGLISIGILIPYYFTLSLFRRIIGNKYSFKLEI